MLYGLEGGREYFKHGIYFKYSFNFDSNDVFLVTFTEGVSSLLV